MQGSWGNIFHLYVNQHIYIHIGRSLVMLDVMTSMTGCFLLFVLQHKLPFKFSHFPQRNFRRFIHWLNVVSGDFKGDPIPIKVRINSCRAARLIVLIAILPPGQPLHENRRLYFLAFATFLLLLLERGHGTLQHSHHNLWLSISKILPFKLKWWTKGAVSQAVTSPDSWLYLSSRQS